MRPPWSDRALSRGSTTARDSIEGSAAGDILELQLWNALELQHGILLKALQLEILWKYSSGMLLNYSTESYWRLRSWRYSGNTALKCSWTTARDLIEGSAAGDTLEIQLWNALELQHGILLNALQLKILWKYSSGMILNNSTGSYWRLCS